MYSHCMLISLYDEFHIGCVFSFLLDQKMVSYFPSLLHYNGNAHVSLAPGIFKLRVHWAPEAVLNLPTYLTEKE